MTQFHPVRMTDRVPPHLFFLICSSVIPYVCDQLALARLSRATFALLLALLPASATLIGIGVLQQIPTLMEGVGILLVAGGVALHRERDTQPHRKVEPTKQQT